MKRLVLTVLLLPLALPCTAASDGASNRATAHISFKVHVPPVSRILQTTLIAGGYEHRVWANTKPIVINGKEYRFTRVGETTLFVPSSKDAFIVQGL
ncbi:hypothetical protein J7E70_33520 [Variovorax paradoxus]|nr:hypothetical protein [Variovorax paradoxus]MBT2305324.1 hypothetical protein [Variovorax paradoxus]